MSFHNLTQTFRNSLNQPDIALSFGLGMGYAGLHVGTKIIQLCLPERLSSRVIETVNDIKYIVLGIFLNATLVTTLSKFSCRKTSYSYCLIPNKLLPGIGAGLIVLLNIY